MRSTAVLFSTLILVSCGENWTCKVNEEIMYSVNTSGQIGSIGKGCSCEEIRIFELRTSGKVDEDYLKKEDFGC